jgi:predicted nucleic acid-binding protein
MIFYDTNMLIYYTVYNLDTTKHHKSNELIKKSMFDNEFYITPLVLSEYIYSLAKLKVPTELKIYGINTFKEYVNHQIDNEIVLKSFDLSQNLGMDININDCIHILLAERHCEKLITYDKDFKHFIGKVNIEIDILS